jgi:UDP-2,4-diacetamido-2,4,6-trideoxy-beta-L-altropyranose hydrolase
MPAGTLIIRADASTTMGTGHVMRCLALAQGWRDGGGNVVFAMAESTPAIDQHLRTEGVDVAKLKPSLSTFEDAREVSKLARDDRATWVVVDGYHFDSEYQRSLTNAGLKLLFVDDCAQCGHHFADLVLDQNAHANAEMYANRESYTRLLLGPRFVLLRRDFQLWRHWERRIPGIARRLLITMGGSDPDQLTLRLIEALPKISLSNVEITVVAGGSNPLLSELQQASRDSGEIHLVSNTNNMPELMAQSDLAIICAGGTLWELLYMGCPTLSYSRTPIQAAIISELNTAGVVRSLGSVEDFEESMLATAVDDLVASQEAREKMARLGRRLVDGGGIGRILQYIAPGGET